jgi:hypothetical protein
VKLTQSITLTKTMKTPFLATSYIQSHPSNRLVARLLLSGMFLIAALTGSYQKSQSAPLEDPRVVVSQETPPKEPPASAILPFKLEVIEVPSSNMPGIHSYASGSANGKWLVLGGRTGGLHGFTNNKKDNFPRRTVNTVAYVIDPIKNQLLGSVDLVANLPPGLAGPLTATNPEFVQVDSRLYILGGYGQDLPAETLTTFGTITMVDLPGLIGAITDGSTDIKSYFTQTPAPDNRLKVAGGVLKYYKGTFFLVFGQDFTGYYSVENRDYNRAGGQFQKYTEKVRVFTLNADLSIDKFSEIDGGYDESLPYHRRDLNVVDTILSDGSTPGATVYGGVFRAGRVAGHTMPIDIQLAPATPVVTVRTGFQQALCQYDCAYVPIFDSASSSTFTTLFGGISQYHYDPTRNILIQDEVDLSNGVDGLPFISTISTIQRQGVDGTFSQFIHPSPMPGLLGTDAQFLVSQTAVAAEQFFSNRVLNLSKLGGRTLIGHIVGGIESYGPYSGLVAQSPSTVSSTRLFEVWVTPGPDAFTVMPPLPKTLTKYVQPPKP